MVRIITWVLLIYIMYFSSWLVDLSLLMISFVFLSLLFAVLVQFTCYADSTCELSSPISTEVSSTRECCLSGLPGTRSYVPINDATACNECIGNQQAFTPIHFTCCMSVSVTNGLKASEHNAASISVLLCIFL